MTTDFQNYLQFATVSGHLTNGELPTIASSLISAGSYTEDELQTSCPALWPIDAWIGMLRLPYAQRLLIASNMLLKEYARVSK